MTHRRVILAAGISVALAAAACHEDDLFSPAVPQYTGGAMFQRYVSMGNSITAGFQSAGINDSTQLQSYAVLLARQAQTPFFVPLMARPGCPPPYTNVYAQTRVPPVVPDNCALRSTQAVPPPSINNVAVPGGAGVAGLANFRAGLKAN